jgi:hypothetical protein
MANPNKVGLVIGALLGGWHLFWSLLVAVGWAQPFLDFIFWAHMIRSVYVVKAFEPIAALTLIVITSMIGYVFGCVGAVLWNRMHRS